MELSFSREQETVHIGERARGPQIELIRQNAPP
jgi:hypothetical protein